MSSGYLLALGSFDPPHSAHEGIAELRVFENWAENALELLGQVVDVKVVNDERLATMIIGDREVFTLIQRLLANLDVFAHEAAEFDERVISDLNGGRVEGGSNLLHLGDHWRQFFRAVHPFVVRLHGAP